MAAAAGGTVENGLASRYSSIPGASVFRAMATTPIENLLTATAGGDREAFAALYDRFAPRLLGMIVKVLGGRGDAEDVLQIVFREIWRRADRFDPERGAAEAWLIMLARARAIDHVRSRAANAGVAEARREWSADDGFRGGDEELAAQAREAVAQLPPEQREAIGLAFYRGLTARQVADLQGVPHGTAKTRIRLGMARLREHLEPQFEESTS